MPTRKPKDNFDMPKVLGLTLIRWLLLLISFIVSLVIGEVGSGLIAELAQKIRPDDVAFLKFMLGISFLGSVIVLFVILDALIAKIRGKD